MLERTPNLVEVQEKDFKMRKNWKQWRKGGKWCRAGLVINTNNLITHYFLIIFSECNSSSDCPNGGTDFDCTSNTCVCQSGLVEDSNDSDACVGMLYHSLCPFENENLIWYIVKC